MTGQSARRKGSHRDVRPDQLAFDSVFNPALTLIFNLNQRLTGNAKLTILCKKKFFDSEGIVTLF